MSSFSFFIYIFITLIISAPPKQQLFYNDGTGTSNFNSRTGSVDIRNGDSDCPNGNNNTCLRLRGDSEDSPDERIEILVTSTVGYYDITLEFDAKGSSGINNCYATYKVGYSVVVSFQTIWTTNGNAFDGTFVFNLNADNTDDDLRIRIGNNDKKSDECHIDNIYVFGIPITPSPTDEPTINPTVFPTTNPSISPTKFTETPTNYPTKKTESPTMNPTVFPTMFPTIFPTKSTTSPTINPSVTPTNYPSVFSTSVPSLSPSLIPSQTPTKYPTTVPTKNPTTFPTTNPSTLPTISTETPSVTPTVFPNVSPTIAPSSTPTENPSSLSIIDPTIVPSSTSTENPSSLFVNISSATPTVFPTVFPTFGPTNIEDSESLKSMRNSSLVMLIVIPISVCLCFTLILYLFTYYYYHGKKKTNSIEMQSSKINSKSSRDDVPFNDQVILGERTTNNNETIGESINSKQSIDNETEMTPQIDKPSESPVRVITKQGNDVEGYVNNNDTQIQSEDKKDIHFENEYS